jgi:hypothetical protein
MSDTGVAKRASDATAERVHAAVVELGYRPDSVGRALQARRSRLVPLRREGLVVVLYDTRDRPVTREAYPLEMRAQLVCATVLLGAVASPQPAAKSRLPCAASLTISPLRPRRPSAWLPAATRRGRAADSDRFGRVATLDAAGHFYQRALTVTHPTTRRHGRRRPTIHACREAATAKGADPRLSPRMTVESHDLRRPATCDRLSLCRVAVGRWLLHGP